MALASIKSIPIRTEAAGPSLCVVFYLEQVDDQRASVTQVIDYLKVIDVTVH